MSYSEYKMAEPKPEGTNPIRWPEYSDCQFEDCADCGLVILGKVISNLRKMVLLALFE